MIPHDVNNELKLPEGSLRLGSDSKQVIEETIKEAINFPSGISKEEQEVTKLYSYENIEIAVEKPGKEFFETGIKYYDGKKANNPNDMTPAIYINNNRISKNLAFTDIFEIFEGFMKDDDTDSLEVLASILFRQAFMLDHFRNNNGDYRLVIPKNSLAFLESRKPFINEIPIRAFILLLEVLALNESVKYFTLGYPIRGGIGRANNLLTCCHLIAVLLQRTSLWKFAGALSRPPSGVAPLAQKNGKEYFSPLA